MALLVFRWATNDAPLLMLAQDHGPNEVDRFLRDYIDTVPHLEAFLLLWNSYPRDWTISELAETLFVTPEVAKNITEDLVRQRLIVPAVGVAEAYRYRREPARDQLIASVDSTYRRELIRVSTLIHSKPSAAVREFARAFRLKKDRE